MARMWVAVVMRLPPFKLCRGDCAILESWTGAGTVEARTLKRARIGGVGGGAATVASSNGPRGIGMGNEDADPSIGSTETLERLIEANSAAVTRLADALIDRAPNHASLLAGVFCK